MDSNNNLDSSNVVQNSSEVLSSSTNQTQTNNSNNAAHSDSKTEEIKPLDTTLPMDEIKRMLQIQLEYYFSRDNLSHDSYLLSQMDSDQYVPIITVANFDQVKKITRNMDLIVEVLKGSQCVQVDASGSKVRPITKRCILILREIPDETPQSEVEKLFDHKNCPKFVSCSFAHNNSWYIAFDSDADAQRAFKYLREEVKYFNGKPIMTRIKNQPITATYSTFKSAGPGQPVAVRPAAAAPLPQTPINPSAITGSYAGAGNLIPNQETYASMQTNPSLLNQRIPYAPLPNYPNQAFPQFYPLIQQWQPTSYCDISTIFQINGLAACATIKHYNANNVASSSTSNNSASTSNGRSGFPMRSGAGGSGGSSSSGLHGGRKNSNSNPSGGGGPHTRHNPSQSTSAASGLPATTQPLASGSSMATSSTSGSNAINSNRLYNESYMAEQPAAGQSQSGYPSKSYSGRTSSQPTTHQLGANGSNNLSSGLAGGSTSQPLSNSRTSTSAYPPASSYRNTYDYGPSYPKKKSPNELATNSSQPAARTASSAAATTTTDHSHYSSGSGGKQNVNLPNPGSSGILASSGGNMSSFNQKSASRDLDQKSVSSASSLKGSRNNNSRGKKSPRDEALLPNHAYAEHSSSYHNQNVYSTAYRDGSRGDRREPRSKRADYVTSAAAASKADEHKQQFDLQATAFPPLPGAKPGDSASAASSQSAAGQPAATSSASKASAKGADCADGGCLADVVKGVAKVQREPAGGKPGEEPELGISSNSKKDQKAQPNHSLNSSSSSPRPCSFDEPAGGKPKSSCSTASSSAPPPTATNHHPNASQVDSYANLTQNSANSSSQVPAKSNKPAKSGGQSKTSDSATDEPLDSRTADSSSVSSKSVCSYDSQRSDRSADLPGSKLSIDSNASSTNSQSADKLAAAAAELTLNGHLDGNKKLMSYSDVAKLLKNNGGNGGNGGSAAAGQQLAGGNNGNGLSLNDCSQNSSASSSNSNVNSLSTPLNKSALDSKERDHREGKKVSSKREYRSDRSDRDSGSRKDKNRESRNNRLNTSHRERREKKDWVYGEKQAKVN